MTLRSRIIFGIRFGLAIGLFACEAPPPTPSAPESVGACTRLSREFVQIAQKRDRGETRHAQIEHAYDVADDPATSDPNGTLRYLMQTIDFVYGRPDVSAEGIGALVQGSCLVNDEGRAVLYLPQP